VVGLVTVRVDWPELAVLFKSPPYVAVILTGPVVGVNVTVHVPDTSVQEFTLKEPEPVVVVNVTVPVGDVPVTETETVVGTPTLTDDGESVTMVVGYWSYSKSVCSRACCIKYITIIFSCDHSRAD